MRDLGLNQRTRLASFIISHVELRSYAVVGTVNKGDEYHATIAHTGGVLACVRLTQVGHPVQAEVSPLDIVRSSRQEVLLMDVVKERIKRALRAFGLYESVHRLWVRRPDFRVLCWNAGYRLAGAADGLPIPPTRLIYLVTNWRESSWFLRSGQLGQESILYALHRNGVRAEDMEAILDFGCGCARIIRHWKSLKGPRLCGTDYNPDLIAWCQKELDGLAEFETNNLIPPFDYVDEKFDLIYAISVFTHLTEDLQHAWMNELARVLKPGGLLLITVHGESRLYQLEPEEQQRFRSGQLLIRHEAAVGTNVCGAYCPERYVRENLAKAFEVADFIPVGARDANHDVFLLRKPARSSGSKGS